MSNRPAKPAMSMLLLPEHAFKSLQKGSFPVLLKDVEVGDKIAVAVQPRNIQLSFDDMEELCCATDFYATVQSIRTLQSQSPDDVGAFAKHMKTSDADAKARMVEYEKSNPPHCLVNLVPEIPAPVSKSAATNNPKLVP